MKKLTDKEMTIMEVLWQHGEQSIRDLINYLPEPVPHFNTMPPMYAVWRCTA